MATSAKKTTAAIIAAYFNPSIVDHMIAAARETLVKQNVSISHFLKVPGTYEVPLVVDQLLSSHKVDIVVVVGYIERGHTLHGEVMGHAVHRALIDLQLKHKTPIGLGIIGPGASLEQAQQRKADYGRAAAQAALQQYQLLQQI